MCQSEPRDGAWEGGATHEPITSLITLIGVSESCFHTPSSDVSHIVLTIMVENYLYICRKVATLGKICLGGVTITIVLLLRI